MASSMVTETRITPELRAWLMEELRFPVMATIGKDCMPKLSVIWFDLHPDRDDVVLLNTLAGRVKDRQLRRDPRVSLCFEDGYEYMTLEGTVTLREDHDFMDIERLRDHYADDSDFRTQGAERVSLLLSVRRVLTHFERLQGLPASEG